MNTARREYLRIVIAVALRVAPKSVKRAFVDRTDERHQEAIRQLSQSAADAVIQTFELTRKPDEFSGAGPSDEQAR